MNILVSFVVGLLFGLGIILGGMSNPAKVQAFLDLGGNWDPSLALVMGGAIAVGLIAFRMAGRRTSTLLGDPMQLPGNKQIDRRLLVGSGLFGIGWGLAGICPGPALTLLGTGASKGIIFMLAMLAGMLLFEIYQRRQTA
jgi:uncharacterized protein